jgi:lipopolysaccharide export system permease protein
MFRPRRITRYILSELGLATLAGVAVWTATLMMNDFFFIARQTIEKDLGFALTLQILALKVPAVLVLAIPIGTLLGSLIAVGRLSADGEIVALQASGMGPFHLLRPMAVHGLVSLSAALAIYVFAQPWASYELRGLQSRVLSARNIATEIRPRVFFDSLPGYVLFVDERPAGTPLLERTLLYQAPESGAADGEQKLIIAKHANLVPGNRAGRLKIVFKDGEAHSFRTAEPEVYRSVQFDSYEPAPIVLPQWMQSTDSRPGKTVGDMTPSELWTEYRTAEAEHSSPLRAHRIRAVLSEANRRIALPVRKPRLRASRVAFGRVPCPERQRGRLRPEPGNRAGLLGGFHCRPRAGS